MEEINDKKKIGLKISKKIYKDFQNAVLDKYGATHGHLGLSIENALTLWVKCQKEEATENKG